MSVDISALIFTRFPQPGAVNTRMIGPLSPEQAAEVHRASLRAVCENVSRVDGLTVKLVGTPDDRVDDFRAILGTCVGDCVPQGDGDLGMRLTRATQRAFAAGAPGVLLLGADSPTLPPDRLREAVTLLGEHDAVLGPCEDGGYYLLGLRGPMPTLFERIDWGTTDVAAQTRCRAAAESIDLRELPPWYDLDRFEDLARALSDLKTTTDEFRPARIELRRVLETCVRSPGAH